MFVPRRVIHIIRTRFVSCSFFFGELQAKALSFIRSEVLRAPQDLLLNDLVVVFHVADSDVFGAVLVLHDEDVAVDGEAAVEDGEFLGGLAEFGRAASLSLDELG